MRLTTRIAICAASACLFACSERDDAMRHIDKIGAERLVTSVQNLSVRARASRPELLPEEAWPEPIRGFSPEHVLIEEQGVFIQLDSFFATGEGVFVLFKGKPEPLERAGDPSFEPMAERIYWYEIKG